MRRLCPVHSTPMVELFTSWACDACDAGASSTGVWRGHVYTVSEPVEVGSIPPRKTLPVQPVAQGYIPSGQPKLDTLLGGGFHENRMTLLSGEPSSVILEAAGAANLQNRPVVWIGQAAPKKQYTCSQFIDVSVKPQYKPLKGSLVILTDYVWYPSRPLDDWWLHLSYVLRSAQYAFTTLILTDTPSRRLKFDSWFCLEMENRGVSVSVEVTKCTSIANPYVAQGTSTLLV